MARREIKAAARIDAKAPPLPFDPELLPEVVRTLGLCRQQARIVELLLRGMSDKQIALTLGLGESTVRTYIGRMFARLGTHDRVELILRAVTVAWSIGRDECHRNR